MKIEMGTIRASETVLIKSKLQEKTNEILAYAVPTLQQNSIVIALLLSQTFYSSYLKLMWLSHKKGIKRNY